MANNNSHVCLEDRIAWKLDWGGKSAKKEHMSVICIKLLPHRGETSAQVNNDVRSDGTAANGPSLYCMDPICEARPMLRGWETSRCCELAVSYGRERRVPYITVTDQEVSWGDTRVCCHGHLRRLKKTQMWCAVFTQTVTSGPNIQLNGGSKGQMQHLSWIGLVRHIIIKSYVWANILGLCDNLLLILHSI